MYPIYLVERNSTVLEKFSIRTREETSEGTNAYFLTNKTSNLRLNVMRNV